MTIQGGVGLLSRSIGTMTLPNLQLPNLSRNPNSTAPPQPYLNMNKVQKVETQGSCPSYQGLLMKIRLLSGTLVLFEYSHGIPKGFNIYSVVVEPPSGFRVAIGC